MNITLTTEELEYKAIVIALRQYFCDIDTPEKIAELVNLFDDGFDDTVFTKYTVWHPFDNEDADDLYTNISDLRSSIIESFVN